MSGNRSLSGDHATVTVHVNVDAGTAFDVFTREIDLWWKHGPAYRMAGQQPGLLCFEQCVNGRLFEQYNTESGLRAREIGRVLVWDPPSRLVFSWRGGNFSADDPSTEVEVRFDPTETGTRVTLQHRGWAALRRDHPARHGLEGAVLSQMVGMWWGQLMSSMREYIDVKVSSRGKL